MHVYIPTVLDLYTHPYEPIHLAAGTRVRKDGYRTLRLVPRDRATLAVIHGGDALSTTTIWVLPRPEIETREVVA